MKLTFLICLLLNLTNSFSSEVISPVTTTPASGSAEVETKNSTLSSEHRKDKKFQATLDIF